MAPSEMSSERATCPVLHGREQARYNKAAASLPSSKDALSAWAIALENLDSRLRGNDVLFRPPE
jgi:hypothetical protein